MTNGMSRMQAMAPTVLATTAKPNPSSITSRMAKAAASTIMTRRISGLRWVAEYQSWLGRCSATGLASASGDMNAAARSMRMPAMTRLKKSNSRPRYGVKMGTSGMTVPSSVST